MEVISGIKAHTIRMWERRYGLLKPSRTGTNIRFYDDQELRRLMNVAHLVGCHYKISKVARMDDDQLRRLVLEQNELHAGQEAIISQFVMHMLHFDSAGFSRLLSEVMARYGFEEAVFRVIFPFLNKVGTFWQVGSVYPAQEHFISAMIRHQFICELERRQLEPKGEKSMLFFLHENELHELPLLYYAAVAARKGFRIIYLGPGVPLRPGTPRCAGRGDPRPHCFYQCLGARGVKHHSPAFDRIASRKGIHHLGPPVETTLPETARRIHPYQQLPRL